MGKVYKYRGIADFPCFQIVFGSKESYGLGLYGGAEYCVIDSCPH